MHGRKQSRVGAHQRRALLNNQRVLQIAAELHPPVGVVHRERPLLSRNAP